jgi:hypothetical protein
LPTQSCSLDISKLCFSLKALFPLAKFSANIKVEKLGTATDNTALALATMGIWTQLEMIPITKPSTRRVITGAFANKLRQRAWGTFIKLL